MEIVPEGTSMRWCNGHQCEHSVSEFYVKDRNTGRLDTFCKEWVTARKQERYQEDPEWFIAKTREWQADNADSAESRRLREHELEATPERREKRRSYYEEHREAILASARKSKAKHREERNADTHRRRAIHKGADGHWTAREWRAIQARFDFRCLYCGERRPLDADHVVPPGAPYYGSNHANNLQPLCVPHNRGVKHQTVLDLRLNSPYDLRPDLPLGEFDLEMAKIPLPLECRHPKRRREPIREQFCVGCGEIRPASEFNWRDKERGYLQALCRNHQAEKQRNEREVKKALLPTKAPRPNPLKGIRTTLPEDQRGTKTCKECGKTKPVSDFNYTIRAEGKLQPKCRECQNRETNANYVPHPRAKVDPRQKYVPLGTRSEKLCEGPKHECGVLLPIESFPSRKPMQDGTPRVDTYCRDCKREQLRLWRESKKREAA